MHLRIILAAVGVGFLALGSGSAQAASSGPLHTFYGEVKAVDLAAKTLTLKSGGRVLVFQVKNETKISSFHGHVRWDKVRLGQGALVTMRLGEGNKGIAVRIRFDADASHAKSLSLFSARTTRGQMIVGIAVSNFVAYQPPDGLVQSRPQPRPLEGPHVPAFGAAGWDGGGRDAVRVLREYGTGCASNELAEEMALSSEQRDRSANPRDVVLAGLERRKILERPPRRSALVLSAVTAPVATALCRRERRLDTARRLQKPAVNLPGRRPLGFYFLLPPSSFILPPS